LEYLITGQFYGLVEYVVPSLAHLVSEGNALGVQKLTTPGQIVDQIFEVWCGRGP